MPRTLTAPSKRKAARRPPMAREADQRLKSRHGFWSSLTKAQKKAALNAPQPEVSGASPKRAKKK